MKTVPTIVLVLIVASSCFAQTPDCDYLATPCEAYANADAVFVGKVISRVPEMIKMWQRDKDYDQVAVIEVEKMYKGVMRKRFVLHQLGRKNAPKFILSTRYVFYANFDRSTKKWEVGRCGRTLMAKFAEDDLHYLDDLPTSAKKTRIAGEVIRYDTDEENPQGTSERLAGIKIRIIGASKEYEVITDAKGVYELTGAAPGRFVIQPDIPPGLKLLLVMHYGALDRSQVRSLTIELKERSCSGATILLTTDRSNAKP